MRIGIMSFAHVHADGYLPILRQIAEVEVIGFSDTNAAQAKHFSDLYNLKWFETHEELLAEVDAVVICSENAKHLEDVRLAARAGVSILCEKPLTTTETDALLMKEAIDAAGVQFMTAFPMRFDANMLSLKAMLERGDLGEIYAINGINHSEIPRRHRAWFADKALAGGGAVLDHTVHLLDLYRWLLKTEPQELYAEVSNPFVKDVNVDTAGLITVSFPNKVFTSIDCSWSRPEAVYPRWGHVKMELIGENGSIEVDAFKQYLNQYSRNTTPQASWLGWGEDANVNMIKHFVSSVSQNKSPDVTWFDGYVATKVALLAYESSEKQQALAIEIAN